MLPRDVAKLLDAIAVGTKPGVDGLVGMTAEVPICTMHGSAGIDRTGEGP